MSTDRLLTRLHAMDEAPWANYYGRPLDAKDMSDLLRTFKVRPHLLNFRASDGQLGIRARGYRRASRPDVPGLAETWARYLGTDEMGGNGGNGPPGNG